MDLPLSGDRLFQKVAKLRSGRESRYMTLVVASQVQANSPYVLHRVTWTDGAKGR